MNNRTLAYEVSGTSGKEDYLLETQVLVMNMPATDVIIDSSGVSDGSIIKISNDMPVGSSGSLFFTLSSPHRGTVGVSFTRYLTAYNFTGSVSML